MTVSDRSFSRCVSEEKVCLEGLCDRQNLCFKATFDSMSPEDFVDYLVKNFYDSASLLYYLNVSSNKRVNAILASADKHPYFSTNSDRSHGRVFKPILTIPYEFVTLDELEKIEIHT